MSEFIPFLYGMVLSVIASVLFFVTAFRKLESVIDHQVVKKVLKHREYIAVANEVAMVPCAKMETLCRIVCYDNNIMGEAIPCHAVFYGNTLTLYQVDCMETLPDHRQVVTAEHLLGNINVSCVEATTKRVSKYHRHTNVNTRCAAVKGRVTVLQPKEGMSLFTVNPAEELKKKLAEHRKAKMEWQRRFQHDGSLSHSNDPTAASGDTVDAMKSTWLRSPSIATSSSARRFSVMTSKIPYRDARMHTNDGGPSKTRPVAEWTCMIMKFPTRRDNERWFNLMRFTTQSLKWQDFIAHLPQVDVLNLLVARIFFENTRSSGLHDFVQNKLQKNLSTVSKTLPEHVRGSIHLDGLTIGDEIPLISDVSFPTVSPTGDLEFDFDLLYRGGLGLNIRFSITYRGIRVPDIIFSITVLELAGRMRFNVGPPPTNKFWLGSPRAPQLRLAFTQEVASRDGLLNVVMNLIPDLSPVVTNVVRDLLFDDMVLPKLDDFPWPVVGARAPSCETEPSNGSPPNNSQKVDKPPSSRGHVPLQSTTIHSTNDFLVSSSSVGARQPPLSPGTGVGVQPSMRPGRKPEPAFVRAPSLSSSNAMQSDMQVPLSPAQSSRHHKGDSPSVKGVMSTSAGSIEQKATPCSDEERTALTVECLQQMVRQYERQEQERLTARTLR